MNEAAWITLVTGAVGPAVATSASSLVEALALIRGGAERATLNGRIGPDDVGIVLEATRRAPASGGAGCTLRGAAATRDAEGPSAHLQAARAVRRALADGRMKASEVELVSVAVPSALDQKGIAPMLALALSDHLDHVQTAIAVVGQRHNGDVVDVGAVAACIEAIASGRAAGAVALYLGFGDDTTALAFSKHP